MIITNIPRSEMNAGQVLCFAYGRCDQENMIEQAKDKGCQEDGQ